MALLGPAELEGSRWCQRHATPRHATPRHATPRHATPRHATPRHATPRHATPCAAPDRDRRAPIAHSSAPLPRRRARDCRRCGPGACPTRRAALPGRRPPRRPRPAAPCHPGLAREAAAVGGRVTGTARKRWCQSRRGPKQQKSEKRMAPRQAPALAAMWVPVHRYPQRGPPKGSPPASTGAAAP
jgi:hypothetical protein